MATGTLLTLEEFARLPDEPGKQELSNGEVIVEPPAQAIHAEICWRMIEALRDHLKRMGSGRVYQEAGFRLNAETVRQPDLAVLATRPPVPETGWFAGAPDIAIEVLLPGNFAEDVETKISQYLSAGSKLVWIVMPKIRQVRVCRADSTQTTLREPDSLTGEPVLPGFTLPLSQLFA